MNTRHTLSKRLLLLAPLLTPLPYTFSSLGFCCLPVITQINLLASVRAMQHLKDITEGAGCQRYVERDGRGGQGLMEKAGGMNSAAGGGVSTGAGGLGGSVGVLGVRVGGASAALCDV